MRNACRDASNAPLKSSIADNPIVLPRDAYKRNIYLRHVFPIRS